VTPTPDVFTKPATQIDNKIDNKPIQSSDLDTLVELRRKVDVGLKMSFQEKQM